MDFLQEIANGGHVINPAFGFNGANLMQEHTSIMTMDATAAFSRPNNQYSSLHRHHRMVTESIFEASPSQLPSTAMLCSSHMIAINAPHRDSGSAVAVNTNSRSSSRRHPFSEIITHEIGSTGTTAASGRRVAQRRTWQEALCSSASSSAIAPGNPVLNVETCASSLNNTVSPLGLRFGTVEKILNLHHIQAGVSTNYSATDFNHLANTKIMPLEESIVAAQHKDSLPLWATTSSAGSFLSALRQGDEAFFKQQLVIPMEDLFKGAGINASAPSGKCNDISEDLQEQHSFVDGGVHRTYRRTTQQCNMENCVRQTDSAINKELKWGPQQVEPAATEASEKITTVARPSAACADLYAEECKRSFSNKIDADDDDDDDKVIRTGRQDNSRHKSSGVRATNADGLKSRKRSLSHDVQAITDACYNPEARSKRAYLMPAVEDSSPRQFSMTSSLSLRTSAVMDKSGAKPTAALRHSGSKRHPLGPALNTNLKPRAQQGTASDPQTVAARNRRDRINARLRVLQELVPNGSKVDLVTMLEKAINYVKFLQLQLRVLSNDELWQAKETHEQGEAINTEEKVGMQHLLLSVSLLEEDETNMTATSCSNVSTSNTMTSENK